MPHNEDALIPVMQTEGVQRRPQPKDHITPALSARRTMIEFAKLAPRLCLFGISRLDTLGRQPIKNPELSLPKTLIDAEFDVLMSQSARLSDRRCSLLGAQIRRGQDNVWSVVWRKVCKPLAERFGLLVAERAERHVNIADVEVDLPEARRMRMISRHVSCALPMPDNPEMRWPW